MRKTGKMGVFVLAVSGAVVGAAIGVLLVFTHDLPQIRSLETFQPSGVTRIYSADEVLLAELFAERRDPLPLEKIPEYLKKALVTTEDRNFYSHSGVDLKGVLRAVVKDIRAGSFVEGASTITQQLAKTFFLTSKKTITRKIKEAILAFQLERRYTKEEILGYYLNQVYFGSGAYGIKSAAEIFFGKGVDELSLSECALIAGMPKSPSRYSPLVDPERAMRRRDIVLRQMRDTGVIGEDRYRQAKEEPLRLAEGGSSRKNGAYFIDYVKRSVEDVLGTALLYKGGLTVYTTLDAQLQKKAEEAATQRMELQKKRMLRNGLENPSPQCAIVSLDVATGGILALVGGRSYAESHYDRAVSARRQPGSAFKPILYALAIEKGFPQNMMILDAPVAFQAQQAGKLWKPENFSKTYSGEITLRKALSHSKNIPAVRLLEMLGGGAVVRFAHDLGIASPLSPYLSLSLGTSETNLLEMTAAYAVFANKGEYNTPFGVSEVLDHQGRILWRPKARKKVVLSRAGAAIMTDMLTGVVQEGTGRKAGVLPMTVAGKTGTTNEYKDALFIGFSPSVATGVWVGQDDHRTLGRGETGARAALPLWIDVMQTALAVRPVHYFDIPDDVVTARFDPETGELLQKESSKGVEGLFRKNAAPARN